MTSPPRALLILTILATGSFTGQSQQPTFLGRADAVLVDVSVRMGHKPVEGLQTQDFDLRADGVHQSIEAVSAASIPFDVSLVVEASPLVAERTERLKAAAREMIAALQDTDRIRLIVCAKSVRQVAPMQPASAGVSLDDLDTIDLFAQNPTIRNCLVDALVWQVDPRRRHFVVAFTTTVDTMSMVSRDALVPVAEAADAILYIAKVPTALRTLPSDHPLAEIAELTGGEEVTFTDMVKTFRELLADMRQAYVLGFSPQGVARQGWHEITIRVVKPGAEKYMVRARKGYFGS